MKHLIVMTAVSLLGSVCMAKTVALLPLDANTQTGETDLRSIVSAGHDISATGNFVPVAGAFDGTPENVGANENILRDARNHNAVTTTSGMLRAPSLKPILETTNSWTVEGWFMRQSNNLSTFRYVFGTRNNNTGWFLTLRKTDNIARYELFAQNAVANGTSFNTEVDLAATVNVWQHLALTHNHLESGIAGKGVWKFYVDGVLYGTITNNQVCTQAINTEESSAFYIGGRDGVNTTSSRTSFSADYWRISDEALTPDRFLQRPAPKQSSALAYWRMDADGNTENLLSTNYVLSATAALGDTTKSSGSYNGINFDYETTASAASIQACDAIPNSSHAVVNKGSAHLFGYNGYLMASSIGSQLDRNQAFTIEGWIYRMHDVSGARGWSLIFATRPGSSGNGLLVTYGQGNSSKFSLYVKTSGGEDVPTADFPGFNSSWMCSWKHIALTHTPNGHENKSVYELFVDGESAGCITGKMTSATALCNMPNFYLGSRPNDFRGAGYNDCTRICSRVLAPNEFLNATENAQPVAAGDVLAFWPLDAENGGLHLNGRDIAGSYHFTKYASFESRVMPSAQSAVSPIPNPDKSVSRFDSPALNNGSFVFPDTSSVYNYLAVSSVNEHLRLNKDFTIEGWVRIDKCRSNWQILLNTYQTSPRLCLGIRNYNGTSQYFMFVQDKNGNFLIPDDSKFNATVPNSVLGKWRHHAFVYRAGEGNGTFELFINGISCGTYECNAKPDIANFDYQTKSLLIGGRPTSNNSVIGAFDAIRISSCALEPEEFLCYEPPRGTVMIIR